MNFGEVIQAWKENCRWIDGKLNPYVMKDMTGVLKNPAVFPYLIQISYLLENQRGFLKRGDSPTTIPQQFQLL